MVLHCKCGREKFNVHNSSLSVIAWMCDSCKKQEIQRQGLKPAPRHPVSPFSDYNPRSRHLARVSVNLLTAILYKKQSSGR